MFLFKRKKNTDKSKENSAAQTDQEEKEYLFKISLLGDGAVGKTSLRRRYMGQGFTTQHLMTIGADFAILEKEVDGIKVTWQIWDLAGQENFKNVRSMYYRGCFGALLVFDITNRQSFLNLDNWLKELLKHNGRGPIPLIILGNKVDLEDKRQVEPEEIKQYVEKLKKRFSKEPIEIKYLETSAKTGLNVEEAFEALGNAIFSYLKAKGRF